MTNKTFICKNWGPQLLPAIYRLHLFACFPPSVQPNVLHWHHSLKNKNTAKSIGTEILCIFRQISLFPLIECSTRFLWKRIWLSFEAEITQKHLKSETTEPQLGLTTCVWSVCVCVVPLSHLWGLGWLIDIHRHCCLFHRWWRWHSRHQYLHVHIKPQTLTTQAALLKCIISEEEKRQLLHKHCCDFYSERINKGQREGRRARCFLLWGATVIYFVV